MINPKSPIPNPIPQTGCTKSMSLKYEPAPEPQAVTCGHEGKVVLWDLDQMLKRNKELMVPPPHIIFLFITLTPRVE